METISMGHRYGQYYSWMLRLSMQLNAGKQRCMVTTSNPEKFKKDYHYMVGESIELELEPESSNIYRAKLKNK